MAPSITETVVLRGQNRNISIAHLVTNWALRPPLQGRWTLDEADHREPQQHKSPRVPGAETQMKCEAHPGTRGQFQLRLATKSTVRNWIRHYRSTKYPNTPVGRTRAQSTRRGSIGDQTFHQTERRSDTHWGTLSAFFVFQAYVASGTWDLLGGVALKMVPGARIELATPAFSGRRSTNELPRHTTSQF
jgi:hypothetical protein